MLKKVNLHYIFFLLLISCVNQQQEDNKLSYYYGAITRGGTQAKNVFFVFTGHEFADGASTIRKTLKEQDVKASFFFTGDFYRNPNFKNHIKKLKLDGHYLGAHSDKHLLYCDWEDRNRLYVSKDSFMLDVQNNYAEMEKFGIAQNEAKYYLPPYEWYNDSISTWTAELNLKLINFTSGTLSNADYTSPNMENYRSNEEIYNSIISYEETSEYGMNGFILLIHIGVSPDRTEKFYNELNPLLHYLRDKGYKFKMVNQL
jgi:peptidoglycan/xylan/chitin deacetylase (PgdA/CDA1 family)